MPVEYEEIDIHFPSHGDYSQAKLIRDLGQLVEELNTRLKEQHEYINQLEERVAELES